MLGLAFLALCGSALALAFTPLKPVILGFDGLLLVLVLIDRARAGRPDRLHIERELPERVGLSREFQRELRVTGGTPGCALQIYEAYPASFRAIGDSECRTGRFDEAGRCEFTGSYRGELRGIFIFDAVRLRVRGPWGLVERQARLGAEQKIAVEPALVDLKRALELAASDRWQDLGVRRARQRGRGMEFESLRDYVPGDDVRQVDWKAFARRGHPMVRQYQVERGQELIILIDTGRRMRATVAEGERAGWTKLDWALDASFELAAVALSKGDRVGLACFERGLQTYIAPAKGTLQYERLLKSAFHLQPTEWEADLTRALHELAVRHRRRATVLVLSDVADPLSIPLQRDALASASRRHRVIFAALDDPLLRRAADGRGPAADDAALRATAMEVAEDRRRGLLGLRASGARVLDALPADAAGPLLAAWLAAREG